MKPIKLTPEQMDAALGFPLCPGCRKVRTVFPLCNACQAEAPNARRVEPGLSYSDVCICGHVENSHRRIVGDCRSCDCNRFLNESYLAWWARTIDDDRDRLADAWRELNERQNRELTHVEKTLLGALK